MSGISVESAFITHCHVEHRPGDVPFAPAPGLPGFIPCGAQPPIGITRVHPGAPAPTVGFQGFLFSTTGIAIPVRIIAPGAVVPGVGSKQVMDIVVGIVATAANLAAGTIGKAVAFRPGMLSVVGTRAPGDFRIAGISIDVEDIAWVQCILIGGIDDIPGVRVIAAVVRKTQVIIDDFV